MKIFFTVVSCVLLFYNVLPAQADYRPGFIVTLQRDTVQGLVAFQGNKKNTRSCKFKPSRSAPAIVYAPSTIAAYGFEQGRLYKTHLLLNAEGEVQVAFFQVLVQGEVSLLEYQGRFFMQRGNAPDLKELTVRKEERVFDGGGTRKIEVRNYLNDLYQIINNCSKNTITAEEVNNSKFTLSSLVNIFDKINACLNANYTIYNTAQPWLAVQIGVAGGVSASQLAFEPTGVEEDPIQRTFTESTFNTDLQPVIGAFINLSPAKINERLSFQVEFWYQKGKYEGYSEFPIFQGTQRTNLYLSNSTLKIPILLSYQQSLNALKLYYRGGIVGNFTFNAGTRLVIEAEKEQIIFTRFQDIETIPNNYVGFSGGLGATKRIADQLDLHLEIRYEYTRDLFNYYRSASALKNNASNFSLLLGISF
ncbi:MAG: hypothetical protein ACK4TA_02705 [Saprospiraceae bacterium]